MGQQEDRKIAKLLLENNVSWHELSEAKKNLARKVYALCTQKLQALEELDLQIKQNKFSKSSLAEELGINRKTLATHNPEVSILVDMFIKKGKRYWTVSSSAEKQDEESFEELLEDSSEVLPENLLVKLPKTMQILISKRDTRLVKKNHECRELENELKAYKGRYDKLKKDYEDLVSSYGKSYPFNSDLGKDMKN